jgi:glycerol-3-phosphate acyltransferase PlsY
MTLSLDPWLFLALSYLVGAIPTSYWVGRSIYGIDLRREGSGNLGATNTFRVLGWKAALPVVLFDVFKGFAPVWWAASVVDAATLPPALAGTDALPFVLLSGAVAIIGHVFSVWVGFRGGKGVATSAGVFLALAPWAFLAALALFSVLVGATRMVSVGSLSAALLLPLLVWSTPHRGGQAVVGFSVLIALFVIWAHRSNIGRLLRGEENRFGSRT